MVVDLALNIEAIQDKVYILRKETDQSMKFEGPYLIQRGVFEQIGDYCAGEYKIIVNKVNT